MERTLLRDERKSPLYACNDDSPPGPPSDISCLPWLARRIHVSVAELAPPLTEASDRTAALWHDLAVIHGELSQWLCTFGMPTICAVTTGPCVIGGVVTISALDGFKSCATSMLRSLIAEMDNGGWTPTNQNNHWLRALLRGELYIPRDTVRELNAAALGALHRRDGLLPLEIDGELLARAYIESGRLIAARRAAY